MSSDVLGSVQWEETATHSRDLEQPVRDGGGAALATQTHPRIDPLTRANAVIRGRKRLVPLGRVQAYQPLLILVKGYVV